LRQTAHTFKSVARNFGALHLGELNQQLEVKGKAGTLDGAAELVAQVEVEYEPVKAALRILLERE